MEPDRSIALEAALAARFDIAESTVECGNRSFVICHPRSAEDLISETDFDRDERLPYWADIWPSARVLASHVLNHRGDGRSALDLGAGTGLVACAMAAAGYNVTASDYYQESLDFARLNVVRSTGGDCNTLLLDWRSLPDSAPQFDFIGAADVLYERPYGELVAVAIKRLLGENGFALVADPGRVGLESFLSACEASKLHLNDSWEVEHVLAQQRHRIRLFAFVHGDG